MKLFTKHPGANLDYFEDWEDWLNGDTIETSFWSASPSGLTLSGSSFTDTRATVFVDGGTLGTVYTLTNSITTAGDREDSRLIQILIEAVQ